MEQFADAVMSGPRIRRVEAVVNLASGGVTPGAPEVLRTVLDEFGIVGPITMAGPDEIDEALQAAVRAAPDLVIALAGDGTLGRAAELCGPCGPLLAPLPGGTMNLLPRALYGPRPWPEVLADCLRNGEPRPVSCGEVGGRRFYCAALLGSPALWQPAREAARRGELDAAWREAMFAWRRAFSTRLKFQVSGRPKHKVVALSLICPLISRAIDGEDHLEAAGLDVDGMVKVLSLAVNNLLGEWRRDPAVVTEPCLAGRAWARRRIPCLIDGEMRVLDRIVAIRFHPRAFRALAPPAGAAP